MWAPITNPSLALPERDFVHVRPRLAVLRYLVSRARRRSTYSKSTASGWIPLRRHSPQPKPRPFQVALVRHHEMTPSYPLPGVKRSCCKHPLRSESDPTCRDAKAPTFRNPACPLSAPRASFRRISDFRHRHIHLHQVRAHRGWVGAHKLWSPTTAS